MGKPATIGSADKAADADIDKAWKDAKAFLSKVGQNTTSTPDVAKTKKLMEATKKGLVYEATLGADGKWLTVVAKVGGKVVEKMTEIDISQGGDQKKWRDALDALAKDGKIISAADVKAWEAKHPDPQKSNDLKSKIDGLEKQLRVIEIQVKRLQEAAKPKQEELKKLREDLKKIGN